MHYIKSSKHRGQVTSEQMNNNKVAQYWRHHLIYIRHLHHLKRLTRVRLALGRPASAGAVSRPDTRWSQCHWARFVSLRFKVSLKSKTSKSEDLVPSNWRNSKGEKNRQNILPSLWNSWYSAKYKRMLNVIQKFLRKNKAGFEIIFIYLINIYWTLLCQVPFTVQQATKCKPGPCGRHFSQINLILAKPWDDAKIMAKSHISFTELLCFKKSSFSKDLSNQVEVIFPLLKYASWKPSGSDLLQYYLSCIVELAAPKGRTLDLVCITGKEL